ncbi:YcxB family protein [Ferruginibacter yonginensis]|uniref:YcxB family protein n=1 Tax=Ferruginibacter yonginensis TaxID=1310416 RepID=A0ABV8QS84_9BACT
MTSAPFTYQKSKVIQALRYHFISRPEIKVMMLVVNGFAILSAVLFYFKVVSPLAFLISSILWIVLMILFWFLLPQVIYKQTQTFKDSFSAVLGPQQFAIENARGHKGWDWATFSTWMESPHFFHLYFNPRSFFIIPKDAFVGDEEHEARKIFAAKIVKS